MLSSARSRRTLESSDTMGLGGFAWNFSRETIGRALSSRNELECMSTCVLVMSKANDDRSAGGFNLISYG